MITKTLKTVSIAHNSIKIDQQIKSKSEQQTFDLFSKEVYAQLGLSYPKFFKMDNLSKLCFLTTELLLKEEKSREGWDSSKVAIILANKSSSFDQDQRHFESIENRNNYFPSPSIFVYTLPNIMLGEICIRHQITGENSCFLMENENKIFLDQYVDNLLLTEDYNYCITGWIDYLNEEYLSDLKLIKKII